ncbi:hypothetical protein [Roseisolibacter agri]|uniref:3-keto-disaccharide hydrolase domain-containing protein n=1 Tax=Roseisolibacter agri TaxID=2014610 RepID=A0AA37VAS6_9BACT|nr:hypothetical protein [Roseisolibacter agri]GLC25738.1 hypothetical protein rosag_22510 [Roseisolibacter agri]
MRLPVLPLRRAALAAAVLAPAAAHAQAARPAARPVAAAPVVRVDLARDRVGREPTSFVPMVGNWVVTTDAGRKVVMVDGRAWKRGQPAGGLADKARAIYGARHEDFIDNVKAFAYFPIAVARDVPDFRNGDVSLRFKMIAGTLDRCAGILFDVKPDGDYLAVRFNGTEDNVVLWTFTDGTRSFVKRGAQNFPLELGTWHELRASVHGTDFKAYLDGQLVLEHTLKAPVSGKVGLWSKTDSMSEFADFTVTPTAQ